MSRSRHLFLAAVTFFLSSLVASTAAQDAAKANAILLKATAPFEDMVEPALAKNQKGIARLLALADKQAQSIKEILPAAAATQFETLLQTIHKAAQSGDGMTVAQNAVMIFRLLVDNLHADALKIPIEISLLDWAGYQLIVLAAAERPDWDAMRKVAADADSWWNGTAKKISDKNLRAAVTSTMQGLAQSTKEQNLSMVKFAARIDLDLVDLLEGAFKK
jgi:hypothetical protein